MIRPSGVSAPVVAVALVLVTTTVGGRPSGGAESTVPPGPMMLRVDAVDAIGMTVSDIDRSIAFYTNVLTFEKVGDDELSGRSFELQSGVFGARARRATLRLGTERLQLTEYLAPRGRPIPDDTRPNDASFQHVAIIVSDMASAYARLRAAGVRYASTAPQRLPDWNMNAGGIRAFYFRDPDGHFLEVLQFPPEKGLEMWHRREPLFLGIDHTAIVSTDTDRSLSLYRDRLGMRVVGESENYDVEQEHLNGVFGARLRITTLRAASGPGIELLEYLAPRSGRPPSPDVAANDIMHWQTTLASPGIASVSVLARMHALALVSPFAVSVEPSARPSMLTRDPDGHGLLFVER